MIDPPYRLDPFQSIIKFQRRSIWFVVGMATGFNPPGGLGDFFARVIGQLDDRTAFGGGDGPGFFDITIPIFPESLSEVGPFWLGSGGTPYLYGARPQDPTPGGFWLSDTSAAFDAGHVTIDLSSFTPSFSYAGFLYNFSYVAVDPGFDGIAISNALYRCIEPVRG